MKSYIYKPLTIKKSEIIKKTTSLHPKEHKIFKIKNNNIKKIEDFIVNEDVGEQIDVKEYLNFFSGYKLATISNMESLIFNFNYGENISPKIYFKSSKKIKKGDFLISRNASLGKISYVNEDLNVILNGGISRLQIVNDKKWYIFAFFVLDYGKDYLTLLTSGGGTQQNAKRQNLLDVLIPFPTQKHNDKPKEVEKLVSLITQNIINKEEQIKLKNQSIDSQIEKELKENQKSKALQYSYPKLSELKKENRLDTGLYEKSYKINYSLIETYSNGYFQIPVEKFKSGSTPKVRIFNGTKYDYKWVTPTDIEDVGYYKPVEKISMPTAFNLKKDAILFINRTSRGKKGEYVGISCFYDYEYYGQGHHNQGIYRVENFSKNEKLFIIAFMNSTIMRKICGYSTIGSKMKEMKSYDFSKLIFPNFPKKKQKEIAKSYYNKADALTNISLDNYLTEHKKRNQKLGIFQLKMEIFELKEKIEYLVDKIVMDEEIVINDYLS